MSNITEVNPRGKTAAMELIVIRPTPKSDSVKQLNVSSTVTLTFWENFGLSGTAAVMSKTAAAPLERIKLLMQSQDMIIRQGYLDRPYNGTMDCMIRTFKTEGFLPFWRGNLANCIRYFPTQALNFAFKDKIRAGFKSNVTDGHATKLGKNVASGGVAGTLSLCFVYSLDYARTRLGNDAKADPRVTKRKFSGLTDVYVQTLRAEGIRGLYRGFVVSCVGIFIYRGCYFGFYDTLKPVLLGDNPGVVTLFFLGYTVTVVAEVIAYPIDTVRRRMMMTSGEKFHYKGSIDAFRQIVKHEGATSLMKGNTANILRGVAGAGVLVGFDKFKELYITWKTS